MKTAYEMAREANRYADTHADSTDCDWPLVRDERFAELVRADERERIYFQNSSDFVKSAIADEREACAKVCEERLGPTATDFYGKTYAAAIRARSNT